MMTKNQKILLYGSIGVFTGLAILVIVLIFGISRSNGEAADAQERLDSLTLANERLELTSEYNQLNSEFAAYEDRQVYLQNDSLIEQYNEARNRVESLLKDLNKERNSNRANRARIKQLEGEIATLKGIVRHYLEEIKRLGEENEGLRRDLEQAESRNQTLASENATATRENAELSRTVSQAKKLNITNLSLTAYNKKNKHEKNITKARKLGVSFTVSPNATAAPGMKNFYVRIVDPDGNVLGGGTSCTYDGAQVVCTAHRSVEYANNETPVSVYWNVTSTLVPGSYRVEVFCDGYRLGSHPVTMKK